MGVDRDASEVVGELDGQPRTRGATGRGKRSGSGWHTLFWGIELERCRARGWRASQSRVTAAVNKERCERDGEKSTTAMGAADVISWRYIGRLEGPADYSATTHPCKP